MPRIAIIGAGSIVFAKTLAADIMATPQLQDSEIVLMNRSEKRLNWIHDYLTRVVKDNGLSTRIEATTDRKTALTGADYVITMIQVGGARAFTTDYEIPLKYGVDQCIADTLGPGGVMRSARTIPVMLEIAHDMERYCPDAYLLNYVNPMPIIGYALGNASKVKFVGLCHGVQTTIRLIAGFLGIDKDEIDYTSAGINHMGWFIKLERNGEDLYPKFRSLLERPEYYLAEKIRAEAARHFGYFMTESSGHLSDYLPYFRRSEELREQFCDQPGFAGASGAAPKGYAKRTALFSEANFLEHETTKLSDRSEEYCSYIINGLEGHVPFEFSGNLMNNGSIDNLPQEACVEVPVVADGTGLHPQRIGNLPWQLAALNKTNITVHELCYHAVMEKDPELLFAAMALDPLTSATLSLEKIREMTIELIEAERDLIPWMDGRSLSPKPRIVIPAGTEPVETPLDPALAVAQHMTNLASRARNA